jgi:hypothetical protein
MDGYIEYQMAIRYTQCQTLKYIFGSLKIKISKNLEYVQTFEVLRNI